MQWTMYTFGAQWFFGVWAVLRSKSAECGGECTCLREKDAFTERSALDYVHFGSLVGLRQVARVPFRGRRRGGFLRLPPYSVCDSNKMSASGRNDKLWFLENFDSVTYVFCFVPHGP